MADLICAAKGCRKPVDTEPPYWTHQGEYYCSEGCVRSVATPAQKIL